VRPNKVEGIAFPLDAGITLSDNAVVVVWAGAEESFTWTPKEKLPDCVGLQEIAPGEAASDVPDGKLPELRLQEYGGVPPEAASDAV
jgi:hypothetical protein